jgi:Tfp pilus assembly protein PilV
MVYRANRWQMGASMVEVMIALVLSTVVVASVFSLQQKSLLVVKQAAWLQSADRISRNLLTAVQGNPQGWSVYLAGEWATPARLKPCQRAGQCQPEMIAQSDSLWLARQLARDLPRGQMALMPCGKSLYCAYVSWLGVRPKACVVAKPEFERRCYRSGPISVKGKS